MYAKQSYQLLVKGEIDTDPIYFTEVNSSKKRSTQKLILEKTPRTECCAQQGNLSVKCTQGDRRPFGELAPLSDTAPINIQIGEGRASMVKAKTTSDWDTDLASPVSESMACYQSNWWNLGDPLESVIRKTVEC